MIDELSIEKKGGKWTPKSRDRMSRVMGSLPDGEYIFHVPHKKTRKNNTRYKYYFDCLLFYLLAQLRGKVAVVDNVMGCDNQQKVVPLKDVNQLHLWLKLRYNKASVMDIQNGEVYDYPMSTTTLSDTDFIKKFQDQIIIDMQTEFGCDVITYDEYIEMKSDNTWSDFKHQINEKISSSIP